MDCTFQTNEGWFNYRVATVLERDGKLLVMREKESFYYLPGGRVKLHETAEDALRRELEEELAVSARILRPLWLHQNFYVWEKNQEPFHELCLYLLAEVPWEKLPAREGSFLFSDTDGGEHEYRWLTAQEVKSASLYPVFLKECFPQLPRHLELVVERDL